MNAALASDKRAVRRGVAVLILIAWSASLMFPVYEINGQRMSGGGMALFGWMGVLIGEWSWIANPAVVLVAVQLWRGRGSRHLLFGYAIVLGIVAFVEGGRTGLVDNEGGIEHAIDTWLAGWWLWITAVVLASIAALYDWALRTRADGHGQSGLFRTSQADLGRWGEER